MCAASVPGMTGASLLFSVFRKTRGLACDIIRLALLLLFYNALDFSRQNLTSVDVYRRQILTTKVDPRTRL